MLGHYAYYEILQTSYKDLNRPDNECAEEHGGSPSIRECIEQSVNRHLGCHIPWHLGNATGQDCSTEDQFLSYASISNELAYKDEEEIMDRTGCMRPCQRMEYKLSDVSRIGKKLDYPPDLLKLRFVYLTGEGSQVHLIEAVFLLKTQR